MSNTGDAAKIIADSLPPGRMEEMIEFGKVNRRRDLSFFGMTDHGHIIEKLLPEIADKLRRDAEDYGTDNHKVLGLKGQFADIWRKIGKLKRALWEGKTLKREQPREILMDLIGHCLLTIAMIDRGTSADDDED